MPKALSADSANHEGLREWSIENEREERNGHARLQRHGARFPKVSCARTSGHKIRCRPCLRALMFVSAHSQNIGSRSGNLENLSGIIDFRAAATGDLLR
jgi:hypothetical protein